MQTTSQWREYFERPITRERLRDVVVASWERCLSAGLSRTGYELQKVEGADLLARCSRHSDLISMAEDHLRWLSSFLQHIKHVAYLVDADGVVLLSFGDRALQNTFGLTPGYIWRENLMG